MSSTHVNLVKSLGGEISRSLRAVSIDIDTPKNDADKKRSLQNQCSRLQVLDNVLSTQDEGNLKVDAFWGEYNTQEKIDTLLDDLPSLSEDDKTNIQRHFKSVFFRTGKGFWGNAGTTVVSTLSWFQTTINPLATGGIEPLPDILNGAVREGLSKSQETLATDAQAIMPEFDISGESIKIKLSTISEALKGKTKAEAIRELKSELTIFINKLPSVDVFSMEKIEQSQKEYELTDRNNKNTAHEQVLKDFDAALEVVKSHERMLEILNQIGNNIAALERVGMNVNDLRKAFDKRVKETIEAGKAFYSLPEDKKESTTIASMKDSLIDIKKDIECMKQDTENLFDRLTSNIDNISNARAYVQNRKQTWAHFFMKIFSPSYRKMYNSIKMPIQSK